MKVGQLIKLRRKELRMSADELGKKIGKNRATIFRYENGEIEKLPIDILKPIAEALLTTPQALMGWEEENKKTAAGNGNGLSKSKQQLLALAEQCSEEDAEKLLQMMQILLGKKQ